MGAMTHELALRYLLELSTDIRAVFLIDERGELIGAAPDQPAERIARIGSELAQEARALTAGGDQKAVEVDVTLDGGAVFCICEGGPAMLCVTGPFALPGLILHDMRIALGDLDRGVSEGART
jgi:hypothetical protein